MSDAGRAVARERLLPRLHAATTHRLTVVVADAGFGKTELLRQWLAARHADAAALVQPRQRDVAGIALAVADAIRPHAPETAASLSLVAQARPSDPEALAGMVCSALAGLPTVPVLVVLDDAHGLEVPAQRLLEALLRQSPATLHLLLLSRQELPFATDRLADPVQRFDATDLGLDDAELAALMRATVGDDEHAAAVRGLVGRWPAAVRMAAEKLAQVPRDRRTAELVRLRTHGENGLLALAQEVVEAEPEPNRRFARLVAPFDAFSAELAKALGCDDAADRIAELASRGILVRLAVEGGEYYAFPRLLREFVRYALPMTADERSTTVRAALLWFEAHGQPEAAVRCALDQGDLAEVARLLRAHGRRLVEAGRDRRVLDALAQLGEGHRDADLDELEGSVHDDRGDHETALALYRRAAGRSHPPSPSLAYRTGYLQYFRGNLSEALEAFRSASPEPGSADESVLLAWQATALWAAGDPDSAQELADRALVVAQQVGDHRALATSHTILAMLHAHRGEREHSHAQYAAALEHAERGGDLLQVVRVRNNRGAGFLEESRLEEALAELEVAVDLARAIDHPFYLSVALATRGEVRFHQGQYDAAVADLEQARELDEAAGITSSATRVYLGHVYRHRGYTNAARVAYEQVLAAGRTTGDATLVVPALCGLATLAAEGDPAHARALAEEALGYDAGVNLVVALAAAGWVAHAGGDLVAATGYGRRALAEAEARRDRLGQAESLALLASCEPGRAGELLDRAAHILAEVGAPVWQARVRLLQARRMPREQALATVRDVAALAGRLGARNLADRAAALASELQGDGDLPALEVLTLGGFRVRRAGQVLGAGGWPDDRAPALLKRLTSVPTLTWTRSSLQRSMWPGLDPDKASAQLTEAVEALRAALDPDGVHSPEQFVATSGDGVGLDAVEVDVHAFLAEADAGLAGDLALLVRAEARYAGDYLEEHPGEPWAALLREEARGRYVEVARALTAAAVRGGEHEAAQRYSRRVLERDPYDESAHLALVAALTAAGREAEARRCYATYVTRADELGLEAVPWAVAVPV